MKLKQHFSRQTKFAFQVLRCFLLFSPILLITSCRDTIEIYDKIPAIVNESSFTLSASLPDEDANSTRSLASQIAGSKDIELKWKEGDEIQLFFKTEKGFTQGIKVPVKNISTDGKNGEFEVNVPSDITDTYDLYGVHNVETKFIDGKLYLDARPTKMMPLSDVQIPIYFKLIDHTKNDTVPKNVSFKHYGALQLLTFKNNADKDITLQTPEIISTESKWYYDTESENAAAQPVFDIEKGEVSLKNSPFSSLADIPVVNVNRSDNLKLAQWVVPNKVTPLAIHFKTNIDNNSQTTVYPKPDRPNVLEVGNAYHLYTLWDGTKLIFSDERTTQANKITMTTSRSVGADIQLTIKASYADQGDIWIDLNDNGQKDSGEDVEFDTNKSYTIGSQTISIYGKVAYLDCYENELTTLDVSGCTALNELQCTFNQLISLDVSGCTALTYLDCCFNELTSLDVSGCTALAFLDCAPNKITSLNVTGCTALNELYCFNNNLTSLDVSGCTALTYLDCGPNKITSLNVTGCTSLTKMRCYSNLIYGTEMDNFLNSLPDWSGTSSKGYIYLMNSNHMTDGNKCTKAQVEIAKAKNWVIYDNNGYVYPGS